MIDRFYSFFSAPRAIKKKSQTKKTDRKVRFKEEFERKAFFLCISSAFADHSAGDLPSGVSGRLRCEIVGLIVQDHRFSYDLPNGETVRQKR